MANVDDAARCVQELNGVVRSLHNSTYDQRV